MQTSIHVTVAAIVEKDERFLVVAEHVDGRLVINQPAGHWEPDETLYEAVVRETLEETGWEFEPRGLVGIYQWAHPNGRDTFLRFAFCGDAVGEVPSAPLDAEIEQVLWCTEDELRHADIPLRSPQVLRCIRDYRAGARTDLDCLKQIQPSEAR